MIYEYNGLFRSVLQPEARQLVFERRARVRKGGNWESAVYLDNLAIPTTMFQRPSGQFPRGEKGVFQAVFLLRRLSATRYRRRFFKKQAGSGESVGGGHYQSFKYAYGPDHASGRVFRPYSPGPFLNRQFIEQPAWSPFLELGLILVVGALLAFVMPRMKGGCRGAGRLSLVFGSHAGRFRVFFFAGKGLWIQLTYPMVQLVVGYIGVVSVKYFFHRGRQGEGGGGNRRRTNRMLGLSFQSQGMLDMAFDKLKKVSRRQGDEGDSLQSGPGLREEASIQQGLFSVYETHRIGRQENSRTFSERKQRLIKVNETMIFGEGVFGSSFGPALWPPAPERFPTLGALRSQPPARARCHGKSSLSGQRSSNQTGPRPLRTFTLGEEPGTRRRRTS